MATEFVIATRSGEPVEYLQATDRKWATYLDPLADVASCTLSMDLADPLYVAPGQAELQVYRGGSLVWTGPLWKSQPDYSSGKLAVAAAGLATYLTDRALIDSLLYTAVDQATIFKAIIDQTNDPLTRPEDVPLGITCPTPTATGVLRDRHYNDPAKGKDYPYLAALVTELAQDIGGFDWHIGPDRAARMWYPQRGQSLDLPLEHGANCTVEPFDIDASPGVLATRAFGFGEGSGAEMLTAFATAPDTFPAYGLREAKFSGKSDADYPTLLANTEAFLTRRARLRMIPSLLLRLGVEPALGDFGLGDILSVRATRGRFSLDGRYRVIGLEVDVDQAGGETVRVLLTDPDTPRVEEGA